MTPKDRDGGASAVNPVRRLAELSIQALFHEVRGAQRRLAALHSRADDSAAERAVAELFQELDTAHEELRVAEEHIHAQADALALARSALDVESRRYRELFEAAPEAYLLTDPHGNIRQANRRAAALLNVDSAYLVGKPLRLFVSSDDANELSHVIYLLRSEERASSFELRMVPRESTVAFWAGVSVCSALGLDGQPIALRWLIRDISSTKLMQERTAARISSLQLELRERTHELEATRYLLEHTLVDSGARSDAGVSALPGRRLRRRILQMRVALNLLANWLQILQREQLGPQVRARGFASMRRAIASLGAAVEKLADADEQAS